MPVPFTVTLGNCNPWRDAPILLSSVIEQPFGPYNYRVSHISKLVSPQLRNAIIMIGKLDFAWPSPLSKVQTCYIRTYLASANVDKGSIWAKVRKI